MIKPTIHHLCIGDIFHSRKDIGTLRINEQYQITGYGINKFGGKRMESWTVRTKNRKFDVPKETIDGLYERKIIK